MSTDVMTGDPLMGNSIEAAKALSEETPFSNYHWSNETAGFIRSASKYDVSAVYLPASKVDAQSHNEFINLVLLFLGVI